MDVDDGLVNAEANFMNIIPLLRILNPEVTLQTKGCNYAYTVVNGKVVIPMYLQDSETIKDSMGSRTWLNKVQLVWSSATRSSNPSSRTTNLLLSSLVSFCPTCRLYFVIFLGFDLINVIFLLS